MPSQSKQQQTSAHTMRTDSKRLTIDLVTTGSHLELVDYHWLGVVDEAKVQGVNVICLPGTLLISNQIGTEQYTPIRNTPFDLIDSSRMDACRFGLQC